MQRKHELPALRTGHKDPFLPRTSREADHRVDDAFPCRDHTELQHSATNVHVCRGAQLGRFLTVNLGSQIISFVGCAVHVEFEKVRHDNDGLRSIAVLEHRKFQSFSTINKKAAAQTVAVPNNPIAATVPADKELTGFGIARGRFSFSHGRSPLLNRSPAAGYLLIDA